MKSNENKVIYYTFDKLGHQKSAEIPFKNHEKACLHTTHVFWCFKSQNISKSDPKRSPKRPKIHQKSLKIQLGSCQGPSVCICDPRDCKMVPKCCPRTSKWRQNGHLGTLKGVKNQQNPVIRYTVNRFILFVFIHGFQSWKPVFLFLLILAVCKSAVNWLPEGPAAGAKP